MDFVENIGESYLRNKANKAPYQLENLAKKQLTGGDKEAGKTAAAQVPADPEAGKVHTASTAPSKKTSTGGSSSKDAELAKLRRELAAYKLDQNESKASNGATRGMQPGLESSKTASKAAKLRALDGRVEKGKISTKPKASTKPEKKISKTPNPLVGLAALDARLEKGQISTRKPSKALAESKGASGRRLSASGASTLPSSYDEDGTSSYSTASDTETSRATSRSTFPPQRESRGRAPASRPPQPKIRAPPSLPPQPKSSAQHTSTRSGAGSFATPRRSMDDESEHGGSAALLHARRRSSLASSPQLPPLEKRPEIIGPGFRPHRSPPMREVGIVEVVEQPTRRAPRVKEVHREAARDGKGVVEVRSERGGRTLYKVR